MKLVEPPSCSSASAIVFIGKNHRGNWVAQEQNGLYGGLFVNRAEALKYALFENGRHPETIVELSREIELDIRGKFAIVARSTTRAWARRGGSGPPSKRLEARRTRTGATRQTAQPNRYVRGR